jgi:hypothetical protein
VSGLNRNIGARTIKFEPGLRKRAFGVGRGADATVPCDPDGVPFTTEEGTDEGTTACTVGQISQAHNPIRHETKIGIT